ncbi:hypothetical protein HZH66_009852 [Vespula vulgaris]|uniref:Alpha-ketoglutarate-dependent dioxygenase alkB homolog 6 n=1 Tax=Vespula vulgaris TaxID=7454 RepID=A0A834JNH5_VESVU|nr:hypothetical protein HZH66_009852 [Vespula vulgaris]
MSTQKRVFVENAVREIPEMAQYIPNFITEEEESQITKHVNTVPLPKWTQLSYRRLQNWGGIPHPKGMIAEEIPSWLRNYVDRITSLNVFERDKPPNHVLINEYLPAQGIMAHSDGPLFYPIVTTISCGSHTLLDFYKRNDVMEGMIKNLDMCAVEYKEGQVLERSTRLSLTIRHVPKTSKLKLKIG